MASTNQEADEIIKNAEAPHNIYTEKGRAGIAQQVNDFIHKKQPTEGCVKYSSFSQFQDAYVVVK